MDVKHMPIADGVRLHAIETDGFKENIVTVNFILPLDAKTASLYTLVPSVLNRGTVSHPSIKELAKRSQELYSAGVGIRNYKQGETHVVGFNAWAIDNSFIPDGTDVFGGVINLLTERIFAPATENGCFISSYVEGEKKTLADAIKAEINNKDSYASNRLDAEMCANEKYATTVRGTEETVAGVTPAKLWDAYEYILKTAPAEIFYIGRDAEKNAAIVAKKLSEAFSHIDRKPCAMPTTDVVRKATGEVKEIIEEQPVNQGKLCIGMRSGKVFDDGDYYKYIVMQCLYGAGTTSKLFMNVREKMSLCYFCSAGTDSAKGIMKIRSGIEVKNYDIAKKEIFAQFENVKNGDFTEDEIDAAKKLIRNDCLGVSDSTWSLENWYRSRLLAGIEETPAEYIAKVESVTADEIKAAANNVTLDTIYFLKGTLLENNEGGEQ